MIKIDDILYHQYMDVFCSLFSTYSFDILKSSASKKTICIYSSDFPLNYPFDNGCDYYYTCNTDNNNWITTLMDFLEYCYYSILNCTILHGSCVKINGNGILMLGGRRSGKSTLTYHLINQNNALYLDDDAIFLYNNSLIGFNSPIRMRNKCTDNSMLLEKSIDIDNELHYVYNIENDRKISKITKPSCIIFPKYNTDIDFQIAELSGYALINQILSNVKESANLLTTYKDISSYFSNIQAYVLQYNNCDRVSCFLYKIKCKNSERDSE